MSIGFLLAFASLGAWLYLLFARGDFWRIEETPDAPAPERYPNVVAVVPARDEADSIAASIGSLLAQRYPGKFSVVLVDDQSSDGTARIAANAARDAGDRLTILEGTALPEGWSGKLWAVSQGIERAVAIDPDASYFLLTDADIQHAETNLAELVAKAERDRLDLTSLMVRLRCVTSVERWLIPAFVFFFRKLYPFAWANRPDHPVAAAAGGCMLVRRSALEHIGGIAVIRGALIDDCSLAAALKKSGRIWIGLSDRTVSLRPYPQIADVWNMVARTAYTQLRYSPALLAGTAAGMVVVYLVPPLLTLFSGGWTRLFAAGAWLAMAVAYAPMLRFYGLQLWRAPLLPVAASIYLLATLDSARRYAAGEGGRWKGRVQVTPSQRSSDKVSGQD